MNQGYIYVLSNPSYSQNRLKIGVTQRSPEGRMMELGNVTGVPTPFVLEYAEYVNFALEAEKEIHVILDSCRVNRKREFFDIPVSRAISEIRKVASSQRILEVCPKRSFKIEKLPAAANLGICNYPECYDQAKGIAGAGVKYCEKHLHQWAKC